jgi:hypothetical protein
VIGCALALLPSCGAVLNVGSEQATISGSPEGIRAMLDGMNGLIVNGKASPDKRTAHTMMRVDQEKEFTKRSMKPGFFSNFLARNAANNTTNIDTSGAQTIE